MRPVDRSAPLAAAAILGALLLAACGASAPSTTPEPASPDTANGPTATTAPPSREPVPTASAEPTGGDTDPVPEPDEEYYAFDCRGDGPCRIDYLPDGIDEDPPGWPVILPGPCRGTARAGGVAYAACDRTGGVTVHAFDADGNGVEDQEWPILLDGAVASVYENLDTIGCGDERSSLRVTESGRVVVATVEGETAWLHVLRPDGSSMEGWPRPFPGDPPGEDGIGGNGCRGFSLAGDDAILAWGYEGVEEAIELEAERTEFVVYEADGRTREGWPRGSRGAATRPMVDAAGSIWYTSASSRLWRHRPDGEIATGWPHQLPATAPPFLAPDGRVVVLLPHDEATDIALSVDGDGAETAGWPAELGGLVETRCLFGDTPCTGSIAPAIGPDGTLYVALATPGEQDGGPVDTEAGGSIVAIQSDGDIAPGWPVQLAHRTHVLDLSVEADGTVIARGVICAPAGCEEGTETTILTFASGGTLLHQQTGS